MRIGEYEIGEKLGEGGMGEVYAATHVRLGSRHALKLFTRPAAGADDLRARFEQEGRLLARLRHPRVVRVTDFGADAADGRPYIVLDLVTAPDGAVRSLADLPAGAADEETIARWHDDLREGLAYIHAQGIVHRDLKLENVLIGPDGHVVLTDFGISRVTDPGAGQASALADPVRTLARLRDGQAPLMGSIGYMAPELELGAPATPQSDWYALGVIDFRLLTGTWCEARTDVVGALATYDPAWTRIVPRLLHANPAGRACLSFAEEKARDLEAGELAREQAADAQRARARRRVLGLAGLGALLAACCLGLAVAAWRAGAHARRLERELARPTIERAVTCPPGMEEEDFLSAASDVLAETYGDFLDFHARRITREMLIARLEARKDDVATTDAELVLEKAIEYLKDLRP